MRTEIDSVLEFWLNEVGPAGWYVTDEAVDETIRSRFSDLVGRALTGSLDNWAETPAGALALLVLLDQFPRNLYRGSAKAFEGDPHARDVARVAIGKNMDLDTPEPGRQFFYLPFEHSEDHGDQDWSVALFKTRMTMLTEESMFHIEKHRDLIRQYGRFPFRNAALGRTSTPAEEAFLNNGGYIPGMQPKS